MELEEALAQADVYSEESEVCVIDAVSRTINVPTKFQLLGVENDKKVDRIPFRCPKIVGDNKDLSQDFILFINYVNANGDPDVYKIEDMQVDGDNITFSWLLEEKVTLYQGKIQISFCGIIPGDGQEAPDKNRWGTTINTDCNVLTGLKCTHQITESNPDALAQIWAVIDELKAGGSDPSTPGKDGVGISNIEKTGTDGLVDTYTIIMTDETSYTFTVKNGENGDPGQDGTTPTIGENGNWYLGETDTGKPSRGPKGDPGQKGDPGDPGPKGDSGIVSRQEMSSSDSTVTLEPNKLYVFPEMASLTVTLGTPSDTNVANEYHFFFTSGATATTLTLNDVLSDAYSIEPNMKYEVSILENVAYIKGVSVNET